MATPKITRIEIESFSWDVKGLTHQRAFHYDPESTLTFSGGGLKVYADNGAVGEYAGWRTSPQAVADAAQQYLGMNALDREYAYQRMKRSAAMAVLDIALWDLAGRMLGQPIHALIGTYRTEVPGYASTVDGAVTGPLSTPESFADFAEQCLEMGYRGFKMHPMAWPDVQTHVDAVLAIGKRVGGRMDMMVDPYCLYPTFADALKVGRACDEAGFYWLEDPYSDGGVTPWSHTRLREMIRTPLLMGEQVSTVEQRMDLLLQKATGMVPHGGGSRLVGRRGGGNADRMEGRRRFSRDHAGRDDVDGRLCRPRQTGRRQNPRPERQGPGARRFPGHAVGDRHARPD
ncbi:MAG: enolase C-terminal domain-like protein [Anaerolineae bacterium]